MIRKVGLGNNLPRKLSCVWKSSLGIGSIEPNTSMEILAIKLHIGNIKSQGEVSKVISAGKIGFIDSRLTKTRGREIIKNVLERGMDRRCKM